MGRLVANRGLLQGLIRYGGLAALHGYTPKAAFGAAFEQLAHDLDTTRPCTLLRGIGWTS